MILDGHLREIFPLESQTSLEVVILAAGLGQRFEQSGGAGHKALAPIWNERGTLPLLLSNLRCCLIDDSIPVTIVTGRWSDQILPFAKQDRVQLLHNPQFRDESLLQSLARALCVVRTRYVLVLFADTFYTINSLATMLQACWQESQSSRDNVLLAVTPTQGACFDDRQRQTGVCIALDDTVLQFNPPVCDWQMAPAILWPSIHFPRLIAAAREGRMRTQWEVLEQVLDHQRLDVDPSPTTTTRTEQGFSGNTLRAVRLPLLSILDVDTTHDLQVLQHDHRAQPLCANTGS